MATQPSPQQATIDRNRALAMALQAQGMAPLQSPNVRGARISPWEGVSKIAQSLMGGYQNQQLDQQQAALTGQENAAASARTKALVAALMDPKTDPAKASAIVEALNAGDPAANIGLESILPQAPPPDYTLGQNQNRISGTTGATIAQGPTSTPAPRNIDPLSPEGIAAQLQLKPEPAPKAEPAPRNIDPLSPEGIAATVEREKRLNAIKPAPGENPLTTQQRNQAFLRVTDKFQADPIVNAAIKGGTASKIADDIIKNPGLATNQLAALYTFVKVLDNYDSTVREGEVALAQMTQSHMQNMQQAVERIGKGQVLSPEATKELAEGTKRLIASWKETAEKRTKQYRSQATIGKVGPEFDDYIQGFDKPEVAIRRYNPATGKIE